MKSNRHDGFAVFLAAEAEQHEWQESKSSEVCDGSNQHERGGGRPNHSQNRGVKGRVGLPSSLSLSLVGRCLPRSRLAPQLVPSHASCGWNREQRRHLPGAGRANSASAETQGPKAAQATDRLPVKGQTSTDASLLPVMRHLVRGHPLQRIDKKTDERFIRSRTTITDTT